MENIWHVWPLLHNHWCFVFFLLNSELMGCGFLNIPHQMYHPLGQVHLQKHNKPFNCHLNHFALWRGLHAYVKQSKISITQSLLSSQGIICNTMEHLVFFWLALPVVVASVSFCFLSWALVCHCWWKMSSVLRLRQTYAFF